MARARNIRPSMMANEDLAELDGLTRLLFSYLWMLADREGRLADRPKRIAALALPFDRSADVGAMLSDLAAAGFIDRYSAGGVNVIQILAFHKHQNPHATEKDSDLPDINGYTTVNERQKNGCITGKSKLVQVGLTVKADLDKPTQTLDPLNENALIPDPFSLIPDSKNTASESVDNSVPVDNSVDPVFVFLENQGIQNLNPNDPEFTRLKSGGADLGYWEHAASVAVGTQNLGFAYVLGIVRNQLAKSKQGSSTVPARKGPDPALAKLDADKAVTKPPSESMRLELAALKAKTWQERQQKALNQGSAHAAQ